MTLTYQLKNKLYLNITNRCPCACIFCIRMEKDGVGDGENLWLEREPTTQDVIDDLKNRDITIYNEIVFCGYGEPTENLNVMLEVCRYIKTAAPQLPVRLNTNGLSDLINNRETAILLKGLVDTVSISLNAPNARRYDEISRPSEAMTSPFDSMIKFAGECKKYVASVVFTVVDILLPDEVAECQRIANDMGIPLRIRSIE